MTATVHDLPTATTRAARRVDEIQRAITNPGPQKLISVYECDGSVVVRVGEIETWNSVHDADEIRAELDAAIRAAEVKL